jgi:hypothetical protein
MAAVSIRKSLVLIEEIGASNGIPLERPLRTVAAAAVVPNTCAGRYVDDLSPLAERYCEPLGGLLANMAVDALGAPAEAYGKGALVGLGGEVEHGSAIIHNLTFGNQVRRLVEGEALLPSAEKRGAAGSSLDLALKHTVDPTRRSHHQTLEVRIPDAPAYDEIVIWVTLASGGRPHARLPEFGSELAEDRRPGTGARP